MTPFSSANAVLIELPEVGQMGKKWAKNMKFYKFCIISQKLFNELFLNCIK